MKFTMLASGSKGNACIIETKDQRILIDCGTTKRYLTQRFTELDMGFDDIDAVLITHVHSDHVSQLKHFNDKPIYSPSEHEWRKHEVLPYTDFNIGDVNVLPVKTSHDDENSVGYVIKADDEMLVYITDTGYIREQDFAYIRNADYYIMESNHDPEMLMQTNRPYQIKRRILSDEGHLSNEDAGLVLKEVAGRRTREIVLAHLSGEANTEEMALATVKGILDSDDINVKAARQFEVVTGGKGYESQQ